MTRVGTQTSDDSRAGLILEVVSEARHSRGYATADRSSERVVAKALAAGMTPDGIAALLAGVAERPGGYTDAAPSRRVTTA